jgi:hypothetical protein
MKRKEYRLDKSVLKPMSFQEADDHVTYWENKSLSERMDAACSIINRIYGVTPETKVDRTITDKRKRN